ncbi:MAG TPA: hypothetical protein VMV93_14740 [Chloroflexota bacterium]|nr:hypothetical protein [Chloroflexota bacterium]
MPRVTIGLCTYCGNSFPYRKEPLGRSLCPICLNLLREKYSSSAITRLAVEFRVSVDAVKDWARRNRVQRHLVCLSCGRELPRFSATGLCPLCALSHRTG